MKNIRQINYWKLKLFCEAYICMSYTQAAENMNLSQTGITRAIDDIEYMINNTLFFKENNVIHPTKYADELFAKIQPHLKEMEKILLTVSENKQENFNIAASHSACTTVIPIALSSSYFKDLDITYNIHNTDRNNAILLLRRGLINIAIFPASEIPSDCKVLAQLELETGLLVHKDNPLIHKKNITKEDIFKENLIMIDDYKISENYRTLFYEIYERQKIKIHNADYEMISRFVSRGHGSCLHANVPIDIKDVVCISLNGILPPIKYYAFAIKNFEPSLIEEKFITEVQKIILDSNSFKI